MTKSEFEQTDFFQNAVKLLPSRSGSGVHPQEEAGKRKQSKLSDFNPQFSRIPIAARPVFRPDSEFVEEIDEDLKKDFYNHLTELESRLKGQLDGLLAIGQSTAYDGPTYELIYFGILPLQILDTADWDCQLRAKCEELQIAWEQPRFHVIPEISG